MAKNTNNKKIAMTTTNSFGDKLFVYYRKDTIGLFYEIYNEGEHYQFNDKSEGTLIESGNLNKILKSFNI